MKPREKRTTTEPGLGKVDGEARRTAIRERASSEALARQSRSTEAPASGPPISAPPISGAPLSARYTRGIETVSASDVAARAPTERPGPIEPDEAPSTKPVDTRARAEGDRLPRARRSTTIREEASDEPGNDIVDIVDIAPERKPSDTQKSRPFVRPIEGRPVRPSRAPEPKPVSSKPPRRPVTTRPPGPARPASIPPPRSARPAKSARASIRVDDVGAAVKSGADAVSVSGRQVPKIVRTKGEIAEAPIDHRAGFLLAHIDGVTSVQGLVDIAGMPENEVHEILDRLRRLGIVTIR